MGETFGMRLAGAVAACTLLLAGCGGSTGVEQEATGAASASIEAGEAFPTHRGTVSVECNTFMRGAMEREWQRWTLTLVKCADVDEWVSALRAYPGANPAAAKGRGEDDVSVDDLGSACLRKDAMPVCADGIERGFIEPTGAEASIVGAAVPAVLCKLVDALADDGASLTLKTKFGTHSMSDVRCMLDESGAPDYVLEHINTTRALDGTQEDEWGDYRARWTYHPDDGLNITFISHG